MAPDGREEGAKETRRKRDNLVKGGKEMRRRRERGERERLKEDKGDLEIAGSPNFEGRNKISRREELANLNYNF